jgi:AcrR family transcriptional regulator
MFDVKKRSTTHRGVTHRGRPREFDPDEALDRAITVFWSKGYEGASLPELTNAMGINRPSMYAAFGNKEQLFRKALDRYYARASHVCEALGKPTAREVVEALLRGTADALTQPGCPHGCLTVQAALACGDEAVPVREEVCARRAAMEDELRRRLQRAVKEGDLPKNSNSAALARYVATVISGMSVQAASGATRKDLHRVAEMAMRAWPGV